MKRSLRRWLAGATVVGAVVLVPAAAAWACLGLAGITTSSSTVQPGGSLTVKGVEFGTNPVDIHLDSLTGPVLATVTPKQRMFDQTITIPADLTTGPHVVVATQSAITPDGKNSGTSNGTPARALIQVGNAPGGAVASPARPLTLTSSSSTTGVGSLVLVALATVGVGLFVAGSFSVVASRRRGKGEAVKA